MNKMTQRGAALTESVLVIAGMVGLVSVIPMLAKFQDVRHATVNASRYAAWEMTVSDGRADRELLIDRFFSEPNAPIRAHATPLTTPSFWNAETIPLVRDQVLMPASRSAQTTPSELVNRATVNLDSLERSASLGYVGDTVTGTIRTVSGWLGESDAIASNKGIVNATVSIGLNTQSALPLGNVACGDAAGGCVGTSTSLLVDGWSAANESRVANGAQVMVPTKVLKPIGRALSVVSAIPLLKEFKEIDEGFGCVNTQSLPTQELTGSLSAASETGRGNC